MEANILQNLSSALWAFTGVLAWMCALATYVILVEQRRRKRTDDPNDDWQLR